MIMVLLYVVLMKESKLTTSQRSGFQSLLRSGKNEPEDWDGSVERRREFLRRRAAKGRALGLNLNASQNINVSVNGLKHVSDLYTTLITLFYFQSI
jgi:hypothetical protein